MVSKNIFFCHFCQLISLILKNNLLNPGKLKPAITIMPRVNIATMAWKHMILMRIVMLTWKILDLKNILAPTNKNTKMTTNKINSIEVMMVNTKSKFGIFMKKWFRNQLTLNFWHFWKKYFLTTLAKIMKINYIQPMPRKF